MVGLLQKWYGFSESGTTFSCISCSRAREQLSRCWDKLIQRWDELIRRWDRLIQRRGAPSRARALACAAREKFSKNCFHVSQSPFYRAFKAVPLFLTFHERFTDFVKAMWNVRSASRMQGTPANLYLQGLSGLTVKVKAFFLIFVLFVTVFLNIIALIRARSYSVSAKKETSFFVLRSTFRNFAF